MDPVIYFFINIWTPHTIFLYDIRRDRLYTVELNTAWQVAWHNRRTVQTAYYISRELPVGGVAMDGLILFRGFQSFSGVHCPFHSPQSTGYSTASRTL
jgi:hypothetical protein